MGLSTGTCTYCKGKLSPDRVVDKRECLAYAFCDEYCQSLWNRQSKFQGFRCGFCEAMVEWSWKCPGCGCWWHEPNFSYGMVFYRLSISREDLYITVDPALRAAGYCEMEWDGFDEDDSQGRQITSMEPGWYLGRKLYG